MQLIEYKILIHTHYIYIIAGVENAYFQRELKLTAHYNLWAISNWFAVYDDSKLNIIYKQETGVLKINQSKCHNS